MELNFLHVFYLLSLQSHEQQLIQWSNSTRTFKPIQSYAFVSIEAICFTFPLCIAKLTWIQL
jgi:uncharacterized membrane protein YdjX (TVP38/TMEM64 family)